MGSQGKRHKMVDIFHDSHILKYRKPFGAVKTDETVELKIKVTTDKPVLSVRLVINRDGFPEEKFKMKSFSQRKNEEVYSAELYTSGYIGLIWYYFEIQLKDGTYYYGNSHDGLGGKGANYRSSPKSYQITVYSDENKVPNWYKEGIIYQIFPDRFFNGNTRGKVNRPNRDMVLRAKWKDDPEYIKDETGKIVFYDYFGGNLLGVIKKLSYLKSLGVTAIYLNPIFEGESNHKYDTGNYLKVDKMFGNESVFQNLCKEAEKLGIYIILDGVFSHTGSDSIYFNKKGKYSSLGAYQSKESKYYSWYRFNEHPDKYESWWGVDTLPNTNEMDSSYRDFILGKEGVLEKWVKLGAKGWRLDVADELPGSFIKELKKKLRELDADSVLIGEVWEDASNKISYEERREYLLGSELDSTMNYPFRDNFIAFLMGELDAYGLHRRVMSLYENYPSEYFYSAMNLIGTHDSVRILYALGRVPDPSHMTEEEKKNFKMGRDCKDEAIERLKMISVIQMTFPGVPSIYYGDEAGVEGYTDPYNRRTYPWGHENREILEWYRKVAKIRNSYSVFRWGEFKSLAINESVYGFIREKINLGMVIVNRSDAEQDISVDLTEYKISRLYELLEGREYKLDLGRLKIRLKPRDRLILTKEK